MIKIVAMARSRKPVRSLTALEKEIYRLRLHAKKVERQLDDNVGYLKENFGSLLYHSIFRRHYHSAADMLKSRLAESLWNNEKLQHNIGKLLDQLLNKIADRLEKFTRNADAKQEAE